MKLLEMLLLKLAINLPPQPFLGCHLGFTTYFTIKYIRHFTCVALFAVYCYDSIAIHQIKLTLKTLWKSSSIILAQQVIMSITLYTQIHLEASKQMCRLSNIQFTNTAQTLSHSNHYHLSTGHPTIVSPVILLWSIQNTVCRLETSIPHGCWKCYRLKKLP